MQASGIHGIVLAGVHAWGESPLESVCSRPLLPIAGRPLVAYVLDWLRAAGVTRTSICANSDTQLFRRHLGDGGAWGQILDYYEDPMPRGPAGCVRDAAERSGADLIVAVEGTIVPQGIDLPAVIARHRDTASAMTLVVADRASRDPGGAEMLEPVGLYVIAQEALRHVPAGGYQDIKEALVPHLYGQGLRVTPYLLSGMEDLRLTGAASYLAVSHRVTQWIVREDGAPGDDYVRVGSACVHRSARVAQTACLVGAVLVGPDCQIEAGASIVGPATVGAASRIGYGAVIRRTAIWHGCQVGRGAVLDDAVLTDGVRVEEGEVVRQAILTGPVGDRAVRYWRLTGAASPAAAPAQAPATALSVAAE